MTSVSKHRERGAFFPGFACGITSVKLRLQLPPNVSDPLMQMKPLYFTSSLSLLFPFCLKVDVRIRNNNLPIH